MTAFLATIRKALLAAGFTAAASIGTSMADGDLTRPEAMIGLGAGLVAGAATYLVPNSPARRRQPREVPSIHDVDPDSEI